MNGYPKELIAIVREEALKHIDSIDTAVDSAERRWRKSKEYADWIETMIRGELRTMICHVRHGQNVMVRTLAGAYGQPAKVSLSTGAVNRVAGNCLSAYVICGVVLGQITGAQLKVFAKTEQEKADGSAFNARLCERLAEVVPDDETVASCVKPSQANQIMQEIAAGGRVKKRSVKKRKRRREPELAEA